MLAPERKTDASQGPESLSHPVDPVIPSEKRGTRQDDFIDRITGFSGLRKGFKGFPVRLLLRALGGILSYHVCNYHWNRIVNLTVLHGRQRSVL